MSKGKGVRARQRNKMLTRKRAIKAANKARYAELARIGQNNKSVRFRRKMKKKSSPKPATHDYNCGNIGCRKCDPCNVF